VGVFGDGADARSQLGIGDLQRPVAHQAGIGVALQHFRVNAGQEGAQGFGNAAGVAAGAGAQVGAGAKGGAVLLLHAAAEVGGGGHGGGRGGWRCVPQGTQPPRRQAW
jgi:hypothetical protein